MKIDKEIDDRFREYFSKYEDRLNKLEKTQESRPDRGSLNIVKEKPDTASEENEDSGEVSEQVTERGEKRKHNI